MFPAPQWHNRGDVLFLRVTKLKAKYAGHSRVSVLRTMRAVSNAGNLTVTLGARQTIEPFEACEGGFSLQVLWHEILVPHMQNAKVHGFSCLINKIDTTGMPEPLVCQDSVANTQ